MFGEVKVQKIGYLFPGEFHNYPDTCYHFFEQKSDTGLQIELLQKYLFIPLDIFKKSKQYRNIGNRRDA